MRVLVVGAYGFIGAHITAALTAAKHEVVCAVRGARIDSRFPGLKAVSCDMARDTTISDWLPRLEHIDAVVNCAGILREDGDNTFQAVHEEAPLALFRACVEQGIRRVIQISALGDPADGEFIASKHRGDAALSNLALDWLILRPSLVYSTYGSYGGTSLLRGLAALPWVLPLPGKGEQQLQPLSANDVGAAVVAALATTASTRQVIELVGPEILNLRDYLLAWRRWLGFAAPRIWSIPSFLGRIAAAAGERLGRGPLGQTISRMLERGNIGSADALEHMRSNLGLEPRRLIQVLDESPSQVQDRWHARLYFLLPLLRVSIALLWICSGVVGWWLPDARILHAAPGHALSPDASLVLARTTATADLLLGTLCILRWHSTFVLSLMLAMLLGYTIGIGVLWPTHWLDPFGGLLKNLPLIFALTILIATEERR
ncbi:SDR family oxidoreductase [Dyella psychrodurans]|uniref:NAD-dependent epimerase/dehydratase family protein n=1 Tax=Dyella psychrodurans TaxID=1927960 RepID=A0A370X7F1_9GAMM|nr:SDR family oxidoreductase [Dyella psychrodurans]RDS84298.1 NAD-dependent epimerase/dehydratase family protein [Dyella psychrodurans]